MSRQRVDNRAPIAVANAPVSYGAFELTVGSDPDVPDGQSVLSQVAAAGYAGIDLGPVGYLGRGDELGEALARHRLGLAGAYVELPYSDPTRSRVLWPSWTRCLTRSTRCGPICPAPRPGPRSPTAAVSGGPCCQPGPFGINLLGLTPMAGSASRPAWPRVIARCRDRGYEPTFHPETGTHVEAPWEIERVLEVSDIGLCLETGHMLLGGGDPVTMLRDLGDRVNHVHLKDARLAVMNEIVADQAPVTEIWTREAFCALGGGDLDVDAVLAGLRKISFGGWLVVEQDILPRSAGRFAQAARNNGTTARSWPNGAFSMPPFRLGLVGAGRMGRTHLRALAGSEQVAVTAIAEMSAAARSAVDVPGVTLFASPAEMLAAAALDGVLIAAPTDQHGAVIAEVAAHGLPILCEKPCGLTAAAARASAQTAAAAGVPLQVAYWRRFVPGLRRLHDRIAAGEFGVIHLVTCYQWDEQPPSAAFRAHSGGIAIDMGVHEFDQLRWLTGQDISGLAAVASGQAPDGIADVDGAQVIASCPAADAGSSRSAATTRRATRSGPRCSARWAASAATLSTRPRASAPSSRRCAARPRASRSSRPARRAGAPRPTTRSRR